LNILLEDDPLVLTHTGVAYGLNKVSDLVTHEFIWRYILYSDISARKRKK